MAHMIVKAEVPDAVDRAAFDQWYGGKHMPEAIAAFGPCRAWRSWSAIDPSLHYAFYEFDDERKISAMLASEEFRLMVADLSSTWEGKVTRTRDIMVSTQVLGATVNR